MLLGIATFAVIRCAGTQGARPRLPLLRSHTGGAWLILFMIFNVIWTYALVRGAAVNTENLPYGNGAFFSHCMGWVLHPSATPPTNGSRPSRCCCTSASC